MIDLNPAHIDRRRRKPPPEATPEEYHTAWYQITDRISYMPGGMVKGKVNFNACFHDLSNGVQIHVYAPMGVDIKQKWTLGGTLPGEPVQPVEIGMGVPITGLYLREDVELRCNFLMTKFVRKTLTESLATLVARLNVRAQLQDAAETNRRLTYDPELHGQFTPPLSPPLSPGMSMHSGSQQLDYPPQWSHLSQADSPDPYKPGRASFPQYSQQLQAPITEMAVKHMSTGQTGKPRQPGLQGYGPIELPPQKSPAVELP